MRNWVASSELRDIEAYIYVVLCFPQTIGDMKYVNSTTSMNVDI
jgi:hypothetical protein